MVTFASDDGVYIMIIIIHVFSSTKLATRQKATLTKAWFKLYSAGKK